MAHNLLIGIGGWVGIGVAVLVVLILVIWAIASYNRFVSLKVHCDDAYSGIDVYLKKRYDLIPNFVETVKGYAKHESETLQRVIEARAGIAQASTPDEMVAADNALSQAIRGLNVVVERYPELKANQNFLSLQAQLREIETELSQSRLYYNARVRELNKAVQTFPSLIIAKLFKVKARKMFEVESAEERQNVKVQF